MISNHIEDLRTAVKEAAKQPGADKEAWNRCNSALSNALYAAEHAEMGTHSTFNPKSIVGGKITSSGHFHDGQETVNSIARISEANLSRLGHVDLGSCSCEKVAGEIVARDVHCPIHGRPL